MSQAEKSGAMDPGYRYSQAIQAVGKAVNEVNNVINSLPFNADEPVWSAVLGVKRDLFELRKEIQRAKDDYDHRAENGEDRGDDQEDGDDYYRRMGLRV